jgi:hypothetical protein
MPAATSGLQEGLARGARDVVAAGAELGRVVQGGKHGQSLSGSRVGANRAAPPTGGAGSRTPSQHI